MSTSFLTLICLGTAITAVSFFTFIRSCKPEDSAKKVYWRNQGERLSGHIYTFVGMAILPIVIITFSEIDDELKTLVLPALVIGLISLSQSKSSI